MAPTGHSIAFRGLRLLLQVPILVGIPERWHGSVSRLRMSPFCAAVANSEAVSTHIPCPEQGLQPPRGLHRSPTKGSA